LSDGEQGCDLAESIPVVQNLQVAYRQVAISNVLGLHLRAADKFVKSAQAFQSAVKVCSNGITADGRSILDLLSLAAGCGTILDVEAQGCDAEDAVAVQANLISGQSHESEVQCAEAACQSQR
jgi:phosphocarrier protein HPr